MIYLGNTRDIQTYIAISSDEGGGEKKNTVTTL